MSPKELAARVERASQLPDTFTLSVTDHTVRSSVGYSADIWGADERLQGQVGLLENFGIQAWMPDFKAVYGIHDTPRALIEYSHRKDLLDRVEDDECECGKSIPVAMTDRPTEIHSYARHSQTIKLTKNSTPCYEVLCMPALRIA